MKTYKGENFEEEIAHPRQQLMKMCVDHTRCRRFYILGHFNENYVDTNTTCQACDVCIGPSHKKWMIADLHDQAVTLVKLMREIKEVDPDSRITAEILAHISFGASADRVHADIKELYKRCSWAGSGKGILPNKKSATIADNVWIIEFLKLNQVFSEYRVKTHKDYYNWYLKVSIIISFQQ